MPKSKLRAILTSGSIAAITTVLTFTQAHATRCHYPGTVANGQTRPTMASALHSAMTSWEHAVAKKHGRKFAHWDYAGDGAIDCKWKRDTAIRCRARAAPCAE